MFPLRDGRGVIIIACLWVCALVLWLALNASLLYRYRFSNSAIMPLRTLGFYAAVGGIYETIARMPATNPELAPGEQHESTWQPDGTEHVVDYGRCTVFVRAEDEMSKVNINITSPEDLAKILQENLDVENLSPIPGKQLADRILDFTDPDDYVRDGGAEREFYERNNLGYLPYNKPLPSIEMVLLVPGMTWELFWGVKENRKSPLPSKRSFFSLFTVYGSKKSLEIQSEGKERFAWKQGGLYRIVSGADCGGNRKVVLYALVNYNPGQNPYYNIQYFKELL